MDNSKVQQLSEGNSESTSNCLHVCFLTVTPSPECIQQIYGLGWRQSLQASRSSPNQNYRRKHWYSKKPGRIIAQTPPFPRRQQRTCLNSTRIVGALLLTLWKWTIWAFIRLGFFDHFRSGMTWNLARKYVINMLITLDRA